MHIGDEIAFDRATQDAPDYAGEMLKTAVQKRDPQFLKDLFLRLFPEALWGKHTAALSREDQDWVHATLAERESSPYQEDDLDL